MTTINHFSISKHVQMIENALKDKGLLEKLTKNFIFKEEMTMQDNLNPLAELILKEFQIEAASAQSLRAFLIQRNLPIEVNLRPLRTEHLANLLQEWLSHSSEGSLTNQRLYTTAHRNALFITVFAEEKQAIDDYFSINPNNMLIADDIFNLLQQILTRYFLYDCQEDNQTFFEKENALLIFKDIASKFANHDHRILFSQSENSQYIRRLEFQKLIEFWQSVNPKLVLLSTVRRCIQDISVQTDLHNLQDLQVQTSQPQLTLLDFLNSTIQRLNQATVHTASSSHLQAIDRLYSYLKQEKGMVLDKKPIDSLAKKQPTRSQNIDKIMTPTSKTTNEFELNHDLRFNTFTPKPVSSTQWWKIDKITNSKHSTLLSSQNASHSIKSAPSSFHSSALGSLRKIYKHYKGDDCLTLTTLEKCFEDMRLLYRINDDIINSLIKKGLVKNVLDISFDEFAHSVEWIFSKNDELNENLLENFAIRLQKSYQTQVSNYQNGFAFRRMRPSINNTYRI